MSKQYEDLEIGDLIEVTFGAGTQRGYVTHVTSGGVVYATMWRATPKQWSPAPLRIKAERYIDTIKEIV